MKHRSNQPAEDRLDLLLAGHVLGDLNSEELAELNCYESKLILESMKDLEVIAARTYLTMEETKYTWEPMPTGLQDRLEQSAIAFIRPKVTPSSKPSHSISIREAFAWMIATAACLLAVAAWYPIRIGREIASNTNIEKSISELREALLVSKPKPLVVEWTNSDGSGDSLGDVVWSDKQQEGYIRFTKLAINDPTKEQYQLWIVDPKRDSKPVDGGVFDITKDGEVLITIKPKLSISNPTLFAVTIEKPGGVVVSDQSRLPLIAKVMR
jgi:anti-sigma-K factor RskA